MKQNNEPRLIALEVNLYELAEAVNKLLHAPSRFSKEDVLEWLNNPKQATPEQLHAVRMVMEDRVLSYIRQTGKKGDDWACN